MTSMARAMEHSLFARRLCLTPDMSHSSPIQYRTNFACVSSLTGPTYSDQPAKLDQFAGPKSSGAVFTLRPASALRSPGPDGGAWVHDVFAREVLAKRFRLGGSSGLTRVGLRLRGDLRLQRPSMYHQCPSFA